MKVLHVYRTCYPETKGGLEQAIRYICKGSSEQGIKNTILTLGSENKEYDFEGSRIIVVKKDFEISSNGFSFSLIRRFRKLSKQHDIIHYQYPWPTGDLLSLVAPKKPCLVSYQSDIVKQKLLKKIYQPLEQHFLTKVDRIIASSPQYAQTSENLIKYASKVDVIPLAIDESTYPSVNENDLQKWENRVGRGFFLFVGVLRYYKGLQYLLEAAKLNGLPIVIAGDGPERDNLETYIKEHSLTNVKLVGFISEEDKVALHSLSKAFVFPSHLRSEAFGISLVEAQMFGKPIVSADIGTGSSYVNANGETGLTVLPADGSAFSEAMQALDNDEQLCQRLGQRARQRFKNEFTAKRYANNYVALYNQLIASHKLTRN
ncbi:glycosyltransferase family 4 protein [Vibrio crassostreae]|uniref:glycosyltransferase family 4 protein n=1 Tax=Vibrio crassostreae TaxID=246167 RepID=UPI001047FD8F|nr:glycosyltransferase family 4 protein [Vibrio crassostreae]TCW16974.1 rhamnosyl/mannosyltransferase [Vibrio crassostreae]CAK3665101.1 D-rhamnosyltransferase WbpZ [Vibrio crassostreae]